MKRPLLSFACVRAAAFLLLSACCLLALSSSAAIITERNDIYGGIGCYAPSNYTFVGSSAAPGIDACWIPYGTYTDGVGGTEYLRVTSNLMGVVASILGGAAERAYAIGGYYSPTVGDSFGNWPTLLRPITAPPQSWDRGEYLETATNTSLRLADQLNWGILYKRTGPESGSSAYPVYPESIEPLLAKTDIYYGYYTFNGGIAGEYGSRRLDELVNATDPPISTTWSSKIPFDVADSNLWINVWPTFSACTNDIHFYSGTNSFRRALITIYNGDSIDPNLWGWDVYDASHDLYVVLTNIPLSVTLEDVLSADTGWKYEVPPVCTSDWWAVNGPIGNFRLNKMDASFNGWECYDSNPWLSLTLYDWGYRFDITDGSTLQTIYQYDTPGDINSEFLSLGDYTAQRTRLYVNQDDYTHWRNMTTRLDWKRLGIICQLERQMEITYGSHGQDILPFLSISTEYGDSYDDYLDIVLPPIDEAQVANYTLKSLHPSWSHYDEKYEVSTNCLDWRRPTCRIPEPAAIGDVSFLGGNLRQNIELDQNDVASMLTLFAQNAALTDGDHDVIIYGTWSQTSPTTVYYHGVRAETGQWVTQPSNTVTATINGKSYPVTSSNPIDGHLWSFSNEEISWSFDTRWTDVFQYGFGNPFSLKGIACTAYLPSETSYLTDDSFTAPSIVFSATGEGDITNWTWQATGIAGTNYTMTLISDYVVLWEWDDNSRVRFLRSQYQAYGSNSNFSYKVYAEGHPKEISSLPASIAWHNDSYTYWEPVWTSTSPDFLDIEFQFDYTTTNAIVHAVLGLTKYASAAFTYSEPDVWDDIKRRFGDETWPDRLYSVRIPTLEYLLFDSGPGSMADSIELYDLFDWETIKYHYNAGRLFRMSPYGSLEAYSTVDEKNIRLQQIRSLDEACKDQCVSLGGSDLRDIANFGKLTQRERNIIMDRLPDGEILAQYGILTLTNNFIVAGHVSIDEFGGVQEITVSDCSAGYDLAGSLPAWVGSYGWTLTMEPVAATNIYKSVRADGAHAPAEKRLWKFKNMRDPDL